MFLSCIPNQTLLLAQNPEHQQCLSLWSMLLSTEGHRAGLAWGDTAPPSEVAGATGRKHGVRLQTLSLPFSSEPVTPVNPEAPP